MKKVIVILSILALVLGLASCRKDEKIPESEKRISLNQTSALLIVGETLQLVAKVLPEDPDDHLTYESSAPSIASVSDKGLITALKEGSAKITVKAANVEASCLVSVKPLSVPLEELIKQMPLLNFSASSQTVETYEAEVGRTPATIAFDGESFAGYLNESLSFIPAVAYGVITPQKESGVYALAKEYIESASMTRNALAKLGFTALEQTTQADGTTALIAQKGQLAVRMTNLKKPAYGAVSRIFFYMKSGGGGEDSALNADAKDFPSFDALESKNVETIKQAEEKIGLRLPMEGGGVFSMWDEAKVNLGFMAKGEALEAMSTNIFIVNYVGTPQNENASSFLNCLLVNQINSTEIIMSEAMRHYLAVNGFDTDYYKNEEKGYIGAFNKDKTIKVVSFYNSGRKKAFIQIARIAGTQSFEPLREIASSLCPEK